MMPHFRKLSPAETPANEPLLSIRAQIAHAHDALLADFAIGEYGALSWARMNGATRCAASCMPQRGGAAWCCASALAR